MLSQRSRSYFPSEKNWRGIGGARGGEMSQILKSLLHLGKHMLIIGRKFLTYMAYKLPAHNVTIMYVCGYQNLITCMQLHVRESLHRSRAIIDHIMERFRFNLSTCQIDLYLIDKCSPMEFS